VADGRLRQAHPTVMTLCFAAQATDQL
jgi:hypothetical protein